MCYVLRIGAVGLKLLEEHYAELSVVLLDMFMPVCDGFQFLKEAKQNPILALVPIIVMTGSERQEDEAKVSGARSIRLCSEAI